MILLGIDTGGTFTDFVLVKDQRLSIHKVLSTPAAPEQAILRGIRELGLVDIKSIDLFIVHGSTVATNAVLEGKGVKTVYITNRGMGDILTLGRQARKELYNLQPQPQSAPVAAELCLETGGRIAADGSEIEPLSEEDLQAIKAYVSQQNPSAVAINLLFSFLDDSYERRIEEVLPADVFVSRSSLVLPEIKEYERGIATWLNASVGPIVQAYLQRLDDGLKNQFAHSQLHTRVSVMQSSGCTIEAGQAAKQAVQLLLSGPAGGMAGAKFVGGCSGVQRLLTFDMGGTSTDVALIDGELQLTSEGSISGYPVAVPMVDMHTIGAGGGSIAFVDNGGLLQVGPRSAGADPGPACYGKGGTQATVTDANLVLGRLRSDAFLGGAMSLDLSAATKAILPIASQMGLSVEAAAEGIVKLANEHMARALRVMSVQRGIDPRQLTLVSFGGAGGLHVCALAQALSMSRALVPVNAGVLSALGMLVAPRARHLSQAYSALINEVDQNYVENVFNKLAKRGTGALLAEGLAANEITTHSSVDLRYRGQSYAINIPWQGIAKSTDDFHQSHQRRYGHRLSQPVEIVTLRVKAQGKITQLLSLRNLLKAQNNSTTKVDDTLSLYNVSAPVKLIQRSRLAVNDVVKGPALITETVSTTFIESGWQCMADESGNLMLQRC